MSTTSSVLSWLDLSVPFLADHADRPYWLASSITSYSPGRSLETESIFTSSDSVPSLESATPPQSLPTCEDSNMKDEYNTQQVAPPIYSRNVSEMTVDENIALPIHDAEHDNLLGLPGAVTTTSHTSWLDRCPGISVTMGTLLDRVIDNPRCEKTADSVHIVPVDLWWGEDNDLTLEKMPCSSKQCHRPSISFLMANERMATFKVIGRLSHCRVWNEEENTPCENSVFYVEPLRDVDFNAIYALQTQFSCDFETVPCTGYLTFTKFRGHDTAAEIPAFNSVYECIDFANHSHHDHRNIEVTDLSADDVLCITFGLFRKRTCKHFWRVGLEPHSIIRLVDEGQSWDMTS